tara:strand:+ start:397 stop:576 length:180 start_codon:yes stop_codon:yes gene_type:complete
MKKGIIMVCIGFLVLFLMIKVFIGFNNILNKMNYNEQFGVFGLFLSVFLLFYLCFSDEK